jgi:hypothetical protein
VRGSIVDWIVRVVTTIQYRRTTLHQAIFLFDQILSKKFVPRSESTLYAATCLWISGKIQEWRGLSLDSFVTICRNNFSIEAFKQKELEILKLLNFRITFPTPDVFLPSFLKCVGESENSEIAWFFLDVALYVFDLIELPTPIVAAAAAVAGIVGEGRQPRIERLCLVAGGVDRWKILAAVEKLANVGESLIARGAGGFCDFYAQGDRDRLNEVLHRVTEFIADA